MIYSETIKRAMNLAYHAHHGQVDKNGYPYFAHPLHLAEQMEDEPSTILALLHDVIEDTSVTLEEIKQLGIAEEIVVALQLLTHDRKVPYMQYIQGIKENLLAKKVKIADLKHNSDLSRLQTVTKQDSKRSARYQEALCLLESL